MSSRVKPPGEAVAPGVGIALCPGVSREDNGAACRLDGETDGVVEAGDVAAGVADDDVAALGVGSGAGAGVGVTVPLGVGVTVAEGDADAAVGLGLDETVGVGVPVTGVGDAAAGAGVGIGPTGVPFTVAALRSMEFGAICTSMTPSLLVVQTPAPGAAVEVARNCAFSGISTGLRRTGPELAGALLGGIPSIGPGL